MEFNFKILLGIIKKSLNFLLRFVLGKPLRYSQKNSTNSSRILHRMSVLADFFFEKISKLFIEECFDDLQEGFMEKRTFAGIKKIESAVDYSEEFINFCPRRNFWSSLEVPPKISPDNVSRFFRKLHLKFLS